MSKADGFPDLGLKYKDVRKRVNRIKKDYKNNPKSDKKGQLNLIKSLNNQAALCEGEGARTELIDELTHDSNNHSKASLGWSSNYDKAYEIAFGKKKT